MSKIKDYFDNLKTETDPVKLFVPTFIGMATVIEILAPAAIYVINVLWKHKEFVFPNPLYGLGVAALYSILVALAISYRHKTGPADRK